MWSCLYCVLLNALYAELSIQYVLENKKMKKIKKANKE